MTNRTRTVSVSKQLNRLRKKLWVEPVIPEKTASPVHPNQPVGMRALRFIVPSRDEVFEREV